MLNVLGCVAYQHDLRLVALSAVICILGCLTTASLMARATHQDHARLWRWPAASAIVFGLSVWSLHFVAMLAFGPAERTAYDIDWTTLSAIVASAGAFAAFSAWRTPWPQLVRAPVAGGLLGLAVTGMHYIGVAAMTMSSFVSYDPTYVAASVAASIIFSVIAFARAGDLGRVSRRLEMTGWFSLAICGLHFIGMTAITMAPIAVDTEAGAVVGSATLAIAVGGVSVAILIASLVAVMVDQHMSQRAMQNSPV